MRALLAALLLAAGAAQADSYQATVGWTDPTTYPPDQVPVYEAKYRFNGGAELSIDNLSSPAASVTLTATPGDKIEFAARACNGALCSNWTPWIAATAQHPAVTPADQTGLTVTIIRLGPPN